MLFRYGATENGTIEKKAHIYTQSEHGIDPHLVDPDAMWVVRGLRKEGFHVYIVGGAVRDMIVGRVPNDFDVATDAHPQQIRRVFRSARITMICLYSNPMGIILHFPSLTVEAKNEGKNGH